MKKSMLICLSIIISVCLLSSCECKHQWDNPTCETPKTCFECGTTEGEALGHEWISATCTTPETCSRCQATQGNPNGHSVGIGICPICHERSDALMSVAVAIIDAEYKFTEDFDEGTNYILSSFQFSTDKYQANYVDKAYIVFSSSVRNLERAYSNCGDYKEFESSKQIIGEMIALIKPYTEAYPWTMNYKDFRTNIINITDDIGILTQELMIPQQEWVQ